MRFLTLACVWTVAATLCLLSTEANAEHLLSGNATYHVYGAGYCYSNGVQPGVNMEPRTGSVRSLR